MQIVDRDGVFHCMHSEFIGLPKGHATFNSAAGKPNTESGSMVISTMLIPRMRRASHLSRPHNQRFIKQPSLLEVSDEGSDGLIGHQCIFFVVSLELRMLIPTRTVLMQALKQQK